MKGPMIGVQTDPVHVGERVGGSADHSEQVVEIVVSYATGHDQQGRFALAGFIAERVGHVLLEFGKALDVPIELASPTKVEDWRDGGTRKLPFPILFLIAPRRSLEFYRGYVCLRDLGEMKLGHILPQWVSI